MTYYLKVPGSTSNLGPGFDSIGMAINRYLYLSFKEAKEWSIQFINQPDLLPNYKENLIYIAAIHTSKLFKKELTPLKIEMHSEIPLARGLGSSAAAIVAGIEIADVVLQLHLSKRQKAHIASLLEGHPDNTTASFYGGVTISTHSDTETDTLVCDASSIELIAMIPETELETKKSRQVLPKHLPFSEAIKGSSVGNLLVAAILQNDWQLAGKMMESDLFHQPYRESLIPDLPKITSFGRSIGVFGTALSGAGPTIISIVPKNSGEGFAKLFAEEFPQYHYNVLKPVNHGVVFLENFPKEISESISSSHSL
ncbi:homoserine kinase [Bacillus sp. APMAM]|nr:homoserine kinase [Bacillus sp. APMAM]RTZ56996.1 homoserine kinase [Bacillus sp. SAJ1]